MTKCKLDRILGSKEYFWSYFFFRFFSPMAIKILNCYNIFFSSGFWAQWVLASFCQATGLLTGLQEFFVTREDFLVSVNQSFLSSVALMRPRWTTPWQRPSCNTLLLEPQQGLSTYYFLSLLRWMLSRPDGRDNGNNFSFPVQSPFLWRIIFDK